MTAASRPTLEVADIFRGEAGAVADSGLRLSIAQRRVFAAIAACRTAALGGHVQACDEPTQPAVACPICQRGVLRIIHSWDRYSQAACQPPPIAAERSSSPRKDSS